MFQTHLTWQLHIQNLRSVEMNAKMIVSCDEVVACVNNLSQSVPRRTDRNQPWQELHASTIHVCQYRPTCRY
jgi:hypothetical protein